MPINNPVLSDLTGIGLPNAATVSKPGIQPNQSQPVQWASIPDLSLVHRVETNVPARVRLYRSEAAMNADASRGLNSEMLPGRGLLIEVVTTANHLAIDLSPVVWVLKEEEVFYGLITNLGTVGVDLAVTLSFIGQG
jgi:hypothetical protein